MLNIQNIAQACLQTNTALSFCDLNPAAQQLLSPLSTPQVLNALKDYRANLIPDSSQQNLHHCSIIVIEQPQASPRYLHVQCWQLDGQLTLFLNSQSLLTFAFGDNSSVTHHGLAVVDWHGNLLETAGPVPVTQGANLCDWITAQQWQSLRSEVQLSTTHNNTNWLCTAFKLSCATHPPLLGLRFTANPSTTASTPDSPTGELSQNDYVKALKVAKHQAEQASDAKGRFLATMSHEIRSPLNAIINMAELLLGTALNEKQKKYAEVAYSGGQTLMSLINDILDFSKIEAGHLSLNLAPFSITHLAEDIITLYWMRAAENNIELTLTIAPECDAFYQGDEQRIRQIIINLINNAIKFTEKGGVHLAVNRIEKNGQTGLLLQIVDTGIGMSQVECEAVFSAFIQAQAAENRRFGGTGLGLSIVKQLVELMSGNISVTSTPGAGSEFDVFLPLALCPEHCINNDTRIQPFEGHKATPPQSIVALLDCQNDIMRSSLARQLEDLHVPMLSINDLKKPLPPLDTAYVFGEADECSDNIRHYHKQVEQYVQAKEIRFVCISDMRTTEELRHTLHRGFSTALDKPLLPSKLSGLIHNRHGYLKEWHKTAPVHQQRILLVEDGAANRAVALALLENIDITADIAHDGQEALEKVAHNHYPLILMDLSMPIMDGLEATAHIRAGNTSNKETPIIALTANAFAEDRATCLAAGMNDYISKPIDTKIFNHKVNQWLTRALSNSSVPNQTTNNNPQKSTSASPGSSTPNNQTTEDKNSNILDSQVLQQLIKDTSPSSLQVILGIYFKEVEERIPQMELLLSQEIWSMLGDEAHILKSSSASFGAIELSAKAKIIELNAKSGEYERVRDAMQGISQLAETTLKAQRAFLAALH